jgi:hypothetical protein
LQSWRGGASKTAEARNRAAWLRIAPSSVPEPNAREPTGLAPKRRSKPWVAKHRAGPMISMTGTREVPGF